MTLPSGSTSLPRPRPRRWKTILLAIVIFISGLAIGGAAATMFLAHQIRYAIHHPDEIPTRLTARLTRRLSLDADQSAQVRTLVTVRITNLQQLRRQFQPPFRRELDGFHDDVRKVLRPDQQGKWNTLFDDLIQNWLPTEIDAKDLGNSTTAP